MHFQLHIINHELIPTRGLKAELNCTGISKWEASELQHFFLSADIRNRKLLKKSSSCNRWESRKQVFLQIEVILECVNKKFTNYIKVETERGHKTTTLHAGVPDPAGHRLLPTCSQGLSPAPLHSQINITPEQSLLLGLHTFSGFAPKEKF